MKPALRAARPPRRSPGLRWALPPLLLLLRLGQILCAGDYSESQILGIQVVNVSATSVTLTWEIRDAKLSYRIQVVGETSAFNLTFTETPVVIPGLTPSTLYNITVHLLQDGGSEGTADFLQVYTLPGSVSNFQVTRVGTGEIELGWQSNGVHSFKIVTTWDGAGEPRNKTTTTSDHNITIDSLNPGTLYHFEIFPQGPNGTQGTPHTVDQETEPNPVSDLNVTFLGNTEAALTWTSGNDTVSCRLLLEAAGSQKESSQDSVVNIKDLKAGVQYNFTVFPPVSSETQRDLEGGIANNTERRTTEEPPSLRPGPGDNYRLESTDFSPHLGTWDTKVWLTGLKSGSRYKATVYSQAANGTKGQPQETVFSTKSVGEVFGIRVVSINATSMNLTWEIRSPVSFPLYTYRIQVVGETSSFSLTALEPHVVISGLTSSTLYNITVHPIQSDNSEGMPGFLQVYTPPGPVSNFRVTSVGTMEIGLAWSSNDSQSFKIVTTWDALLQNKTTTTTNNYSITIGDLNPGTMYQFEIFPQGPNGTQGPSQKLTKQTNFSAVFDIRVVRVTTTEMQLEWQSTDSASRYLYHLNIQSEVSSNETVSYQKKINLSGLMPGTLYNITITPEVGGVRGISSSTAEYTQPSSVSNIEISTNTTAATFSWQNFDNASATYTYSLRIDGNTSSPMKVITDVGITSVTVTELIPGSFYTVTIFPQVGNVTKGTASCESFCTDAAPVDFHCEMVPKTPTLLLTYACPPGTNAGFKLEMSSGAWEREMGLESCTSENTTTYRTEYLNFSTSYNIIMTTLSCGNSSSPAQNICTTGITDPPPPDGSPNIMLVSHNSVKVKFSGFEASHGPIKGYAVVLTTGKAEHPSVDVLKYRYEDFKNGASDTYVTYLIKTDEKRHSQGLPEVVKYEIDVGNESTTCGYFNGKLEPLGSYRASVAGFTNITFNPQNHGLIDGTQSYVTFSNYSEVVSLPQDPGVICGAVFGCIFGALVIVAVGGFIFWRKKRKDAKNNEVSFSQIKPKKSKLIKVENFEAYFKKQQADSNCGFAEEYEDLKLVGINQPKYAAELAENRGKNRYNNVLPYDISRVKLSVQIHSTDDYINANYMPGYHSKKEFIATQGPLPNTLKDFWRMVWEKNVYAIVMLTKCVEQGRTKCEEYWPSKQSQDYGDTTVMMTSEIVLPEWTIRDFTVKNVQTSESHPLRQFHFTSWPDHGVPDTTDLLINFRHLVRDYMKQSAPESPILVHCSAGVGRTGTFIAIDHLIYQMENENPVDVYGIVYDLRMHRPLMVQTEDQYIFLNQCVLDIIRSQKDSKVDLIYQNTTAMTIYENLAPVPTFGKTNGYIA